VRAQQPVREPVEGAHPHAAHGPAEHLLDAPAHLARGLVGEGDGQDRVRRGLPRREQPRHAVHQHPGLAAARAGQHQHVPLGRRHGLALIVVEGVQDVCDVQALSLAVRVRYPVRMPLHRRRRGDDQRAIGMSERTSSVPE
jgi:hypothetical protein